MTTTTTTIKAAAAATATATTTTTTNTTTLSSTYFMSSNSPSGGMKLMLCSVSNLLSLTHWWNWQSSIAIDVLPDLHTQPGHHNDNAMTQIQSPRQYYYMSRRAVFDW